MVRVVFVLIKSLFSISIPLRMISNFFNFVWGYSVQFGQRESDAQASTGNSQGNNERETPPVVAQTLGTVS